MEYGGYTPATYPPWNQSKVQGVVPISVSANPTHYRRKATRPILTILLCFGVSAALAAVVFTTPRLTQYGTYNAAERTAYTTVVTIVATLITSVILQGFRFLYLDTVDDTAARAARSPMSHGAAKRLESRWKTILSIGSIADSFRNFGVYSTFLAGALVTTCITAGFTATSASREVPYTPLVSSSDPYIFARPWDTEDSSVGCTIDWKLNNGSFFCSWVWHGGSPQHRAFKLMDGINVNSPDVFAYTDLGVAVHSSAIGAPLTLYDAQRIGYGLGDLARDYDWNLKTVSACAPVMVRNPVKCRPGGIISYSTGGAGAVMTLKSDDGKCSVSKTLTKPPKDAVYMLKHQCPRGEVGQATYIIGAANSNYARWVALGVGRNIGPWYAGQKYSVQCDIDVRNGVFGYRNVTLAIGREHWNRSVSGEVAFDRFLSSSGSCSPPEKSAISDALLATVATAPYFTTYEDGGAGWAQSLVNVISRFGDYGHPVDESGRQAPWAFPDSSNALEDVLGLVGGLAASRSVLNMSLVPTSGSARVSYLRVGSGQTFAIAYAVVPMVLGWIMIGLLVKRKRLEPEWKSSELTSRLNVGQPGPFA